MSSVTYRNRSFVFLVALVSTALAGCGPSGPPLAQVSGTVTRGGEPLEHVTVHFMPEAGRPSRGLTDAGGRYTAEYSSDRTGVVLGRHRVFITYEPKDIQLRMDMEMGKYQPPPDMIAMLQKYGNPETTPLSFDIEGSQTIDLQLD